jgi:RNA polymerase sigma-70 factor (ECF subfamily)
LVRTHHGLVTRALARAGVAERDLPDLAQEVFIVAQRRLPEWEGRAKLSTWLYRVALRVASDHRRRAYQWRETLPGLDEDALAAPSPQQLELERREQVLQLCAALDQLSTEHRQTLVGFDLEELSVAELAERAQVPHKTVYSRLYAARRMLRQLLLAQGYTLLVRLLIKPRQCLAAWRVPSCWLAQAPLALCLALLAPPLPPQPTTPSPAPAAQRVSAAQHVASVTPAAAARLLPSAAALRKPPRVARKRTPPQSTAPAAHPSELKVIHVGSLERPEGPLPFGFERVETHAAPRIVLRGPRDPVAALAQELVW